ncbi:MAG: hypothetical protein ACI93R_002750 [Flavobacteriales bacterium]|jgi:hypothetical protein
MKYLLILFTAVIFTACGSNSIKDFNCETSDWTKLGFETAVSGKSVRHFDNYKNACGAKITDAVIDQYVNGYTLGVVEYCTQENGFDIGERGDAIPSVCPIEYREIFMSGYYKGISKRERELKEIEDVNRRAKDINVDLPKENGDGGNPFSR